MVSITSDTWTAWGPSRPGGSLETWPQGRVSTPGGARNSSPTRGQVDAVWSGGAPEPRGDKSPRGPAPAFPQQPEEGRGQTEARWPLRAPEARRQPRPSLWPPPRPPLRQGASRGAEAVGTGCPARQPGASLCPDRVTSRERRAEGVGVPAPCHQPGPGPSGVGSPQLSPAREAGVLPCTEPSPPGQGQGRDATPGWAPQHPCPTPPQGQPATLHPGVGWPQASPRPPWWLSPSGVTWGVLRTPGPPPRPLPLTSSVSLLGSQDGSLGTPQKDLVLPALTAPPPQGRPHQVHGDDQACTRAGRRRSPSRLPTAGRAQNAAGLQQTGPVNAILSGQERLQMSLTKMRSPGRAFIQHDASLGRRAVWRFLLTSTASAAQRGHVSIVAEPHHVLYTRPRARPVPTPPHHCGPGARPRHPGHVTLPEHDLAHRGKAAYSRDGRGARGPGLCHRPRGDRWGPVDRYSGSRRGEGRRQPVWAGLCGPQWATGPQYPPLARLPSRNSGSSGSEVNWGVPKVSSK
ncbi:collagen alpha-1(I) chain-like [Dipodomys merriami]|uniref:collagen alpha-1(I) chain-like n=1 Tax=Dipodomys merriami TaxID=94247 RepID=UPI003855728A